MIGAVRGKSLTPSHQPVLNIMIQKEFAGLVTSKSRFWSLPAASLKLGSGMVQLDLAGIKALLLGAITIWSNKAADVATAHMALGALLTAFGILFTFRLFCAASEAFPQASSIDSSFGEVLA